MTLTEYLHLWKVALSPSGVGLNITLVSLQVPCLVEIPLWLVWAALQLAWVIPVFSSDLAAAFCASLTYIAHIYWTGFLAKKGNEFNIGIHCSCVKQYCNADKLIFLTHMNKTLIY